MSGHRVEGGCQVQRDLNAPHKMPFCRACELVAQGAVLSPALSANGCTVIKNTNDAARHGVTYQAYTCIEGVG